MRRPSRQVRSAGSTIRMRCRQGPDQICQAGESSCGNDDWTAITYHLAASIDGLSAALVPPKSATLADLQCEK